MRRERRAPLWLLPGRVEVELAHEVEPTFLVDIQLRRSGPPLRLSRHDEIRDSGESSTAWRRAFDALGSAIVESDR